MHFGVASGKIILFGEHFVVYGNHCIAMPLSLNLKTKIEENKDTKIFHNGVLCKAEKLYEAADAIIKEFDNRNFKIFVDGELPAGAGLGWSAAFCVSLTKALASFYNKNLSKKEIFEIAQQGEKVFHGRPSGIDATLATYAKPITFQKTPEGVKFEFLEIKKPLMFLIIDSQQRGITKEMVEKVRAFKEKNEEEFSRALKEAEEIALKGEEALKEGNIAELEKLINKNQKLLRLIGVSTPKLDMLIKKCNELGLAAKITGSGGGGCIIALCKNKQQLSLVEKFEEAYPVIIGG